MNYRHCGKELVTECSDWQHWLITGRTGEIGRIIRPGGIWIVCALDDKVISRRCGLMADPHLPMDNGEEISRRRIVEGLKMLMTMAACFHCPD